MRGGLCIGNMLRLRPCNSRQRPQRRINLIGIAKNIGDVRFEHNHVGTTQIGIVMPSSHRRREIVIRLHGVLISRCSHMAVILFDCPPIYARWPVFLGRMPPVSYGAPANDRAIPVPTRSAAASISRSPMCT